MLATVLIILTVVVAGVLVATKFGFVKDDDKNGIPDAVDAKVEEVKEKIAEVKSEAKEKVEKVKKAVKSAPKKPKKTNI